MRRRHPPAPALGAWFDGESDDDLSGHVTGCPRCRRRVRELEEIRSVLRGGTLAAPTRAWLRAGRRSITVPIAPVVVAAAIALVAVLSGVISARPTLPFSGRQATARHAAPSSAARSSSPPGTATSEPTTHAEDSRPAAAATDARTAPTTGAADAAHAPSSPPAQTAAASAAAPRPVHLATIVPVSGPLAGEGGAAADAVRRAVDAANRDGGVAGAPIELRVVAAEDRRSVAGLAGWADAAVGGFGAPPPRGVPWIAPADAAPAALPTVAVEASPAEVGRAMAARLMNAGGHPQVGMIVGTGDEAALADAFRAGTSSTSVTLAAASSCDSEMLELFRSRPAAVVLAADPAGARSCADAAARMGWDPPAGFVVAPSLVYASGPSIPFSLRHATTVLGLPWPSSSSSAGAARFRAAVPGSASYRALVSFAATELAVDVARVAHSLTRDTLLGGSFATDLLIVDHGRNVAATIVAATDGRWEPA